MIGVVTRPFLGKEKYRDFRLCYFNAISETEYGLTPESKAWMNPYEFFERVDKINELYPYELEE